MTPAPPPAVEALVQRFVEAHPDAAARRLQAMEPADAARVLANADPIPAAAAVSRLGPEVGSRILAHLDEERVRGLLGELDTMMAIGVLARCEPGARDELLSGLSSARATELRAFMRYPDDSAGRIMDPRAAIYRDDARAGDVSRALRASRHVEEQVILLMDAAQKLSGAVPPVEVALAPADARLRELRVGPAVAVDLFASKEEVVERLEKYGLASLPVVDGEGRPVGIIRHRALVRAAEQEALADMQSMVGASREEQALSRVSFAVRKRLPWLQINLATAFLAAAIVGIFEDTIAEFTALAVLLPVVAGQSGNTGAQSLAVTMRGLALREIGLRQWTRVVLKESTVGIVNGVAVALVTMLGVYLWSGSTGLCLVIGLAMVISMAIAGVAGAGVPLTLHAVGQDPAQSSSIVLTTVTDITGFFSFLGLATVFSRFL